MSVKTHIPIILARSIFKISCLRYKKRKNSEEYAYEAAVKIEINSRVPEDRMERLGSPSVTRLLW